jgi:hypothetical protein
MSNTVIHYEGFTVVATTRLYTFSVNEPSTEPRKFIIKIEPASFLASQLKFQDGPSISMQRLKREIDGASPASPANEQITISGQDVAEYLVGQSPKKSTKRRSDAVAAALAARNA